MCNVVTVCAVRHIVAVAVYPRMFLPRRRRGVFLFTAPPEITPFYFSELVEGSRVQVACTVHQGDPPLNVTWLKDGGPVRRGTVTPFNAYSAILTVNNVSRSDTGDYTCVAANPVHSAAFTAHLNVNGTRRPPRYLHRRHIRLHRRRRRPGAVDPRRGLRTATVRGSSVIAHVADFVERPYTYRS